MTFTVTIRYDYRGFRETAKRKVNTFDSSYLGLSVSEYAAREFEEETGHKAVAAYVSPLDNPVIADYDTEEDTDDEQG